MGEYLSDQVGKWVTADSTLGKLGVQGVALASLQAGVSGFANTYLTTRMRSDTGASEAIDAAVAGFQGSMQSGAVEAFAQPTRAPSFEDQIRHQSVDKLGELYPNVPKETLAQLKEDMANGVVQSPAMKLVDDLTDDEGNKVLGAFRQTEDGVGEILLDRSLVEKARAGDADATALLFATVAEEQGHAVANVLEQRLGNGDFRFDEGALVAREILRDAVAAGQDLSFTLNLGLESVGFQTSVDSLEGVLATRFSSARVLNDYQEDGMEFAKFSADGSSLTVEAGDTLWAIAKAELGLNASDQEILARVNEYAAANEGLDPDVLAIGQQLEVPELQQANTLLSDTASKPGLPLPKTDLERQVLIQKQRETLEALKRATGNTTVNPEILAKVQESFYGEFSDFSRVTTQAELDASLELAKKKYGVYREIETQLKSNSQAVQELKALFTEHNIAYSSGDSLEQLVHFRNQLQQDLTSPYANTFNPGAFRSVKLGGYNSYASGDSLFGSLGGEISITLDESGQGAFNVGGFGSAGKTWGGSGSRTGALGFELLGSPTGYQEDLGTGLAVSNINSLEFDSPTRLPIVQKGASLDVITGSTYNFSKEAFEHSYLGVGASIKMFNNAKTPAAGLTEQIEASYSGQVAPLNWGQDNIKTVFNTLSGTLQGGFSALNYASNLNAHPMGGMNKPYSISHSPMDSLNRQYDLYTPSSSPKPSYSQWLNSRYQVGR